MITHRLQGATFGGQAYNRLVHSAGATAEWNIVSDLVLEAIEFRKKQQEKPRNNVQSLASFRACSTCFWSSRLPKGGRAAEMRAYRCKRAQKVYGILSSKETKPFQRHIFNQKHYPIISFYEKKNLIRAKVPLALCAWKHLMKGLSDPGTVR